MRPMHKLILIIAALSFTASAFPKLQLMEGLIVIKRETKTVGQEFQPESKAAGTIGGAGHQIANLPNIGQGGGVVLDKDGKPVAANPIDLANFQAMDSTTATNTASLDTELGLIRASQSDVATAGQDATQNETGDKTKTGVSSNAAVTGQGNASANQTPPDKPAATSSADTVTLDKAKWDEFVKQSLANKQALDKALAEIQQLKAAP